jgi:acetyltransferase
MASKPVAEAIAGILIDPQFGPAVVFGMGGIMVEILKDSALGIPPLTREDAREMIGKTKGSRLLEGFRGRPRGDVEALVDVLVKIGDFALDWSERIEALDINPLLIMPEGKGVLAVDGLLSLKS